MFKHWRLFPNFFHYIWKSHMECWNVSLVGTSYGANQTFLKRSMRSVFLLTKYCAVCVSVCLSGCVMLVCLQLCGGPRLSHLLVPVQQGASVERSIQGSRWETHCPLPQGVFAGKCCTGLPRTQQNLQACKHTRYSVCMFGNLSRCSRVSFRIVWKHWERLFVCKLQFVVICTLCVCVFGWRLSGLMVGN